MTVATFSPAVVPSPSTLDPRLVAFCHHDGPEIFSAIVHANQIWTPDEFDVPSIHAEAREAFASLVHRTTADGAKGFGRNLLLLGDAGSGKTHLMRAFRTMVHEEGTAYCGYLQMTSRSDNYIRYVLSNLIDSLSWPYFPPHPTTGLTRLATGLLDALPAVSSQDRQSLREGVADLAELSTVVNRVADLAIQDSRFSRIDLDLLRAVLYLLSDDGRIRARVLKWLRCENLSESDRKVLGDLTPRPQDHMPLRTIVDLAKLMFESQGSALVFCIDQLEEMFDQGTTEKESGDIFRRVVDALVAISTVVPTAIIVIACLRDYYHLHAKTQLTQSKLDRLKSGPPTDDLKGTRTTEEIEAIVSQRLRALFDAANLAPAFDDPLFPFQAAHLKSQHGKRTRDILDWCRVHQMNCIKAGQWIEPTGSEPPPPPLPPADPALSQAWNDFLATFGSPTLDDEDELAQCLHAAVEFVSAEMSEGTYFGGQADGRFVPVEIHGPNNAIEKVLIAICERKAQGGGLGKQLDEVIKRSGEIPPVLVRSTEFPKSPASAVCKQIANIIAPKGKGRRIQVEPADWRAMAAFKVFAAKYQSNPQFAAWQRQDRPLSQLPSIHKILGLDKLSSKQTTPPPVIPKPTVTPVPKPESNGRSSPQSKSKPFSSGPITLGQSRGATPLPLTIDPQELTQHAAFLGGSGSGKTTAALTLIEQLLDQGIPAVLLDRKGDLVRYADPMAWSSSDENADRLERRCKLKDRINVAVYTPGTTQGRALNLPIAPSDLAQLPAADRDQICRYAAAAIGAMMGYKAKGVDPKMAILTKAIEVLAASSTGVTIGALQQIIEQQDDSLLQAVGGFDDKHYRKLSEELLSLSLQRSNLLGVHGEGLDIDALLGRGAFAVTGKTRLTIINLQFLGDAGSVDFWLAQFLVAIGRWASQHPAPDGRLQAVFLFDEADQYLPATRQPAAKGPMENLLRRARSAGLGLFLATQSPGDFDYRCRDQIRLWLLGRIGQPVALAKLKPMLESSKIDAANKLPGQTTGQFYLVREREVIPISAQQSLITTSQLPEDRILELARAKALLSTDALAHR